MVEWGCKFVETNVDRRGTNPVTDFKLVAHYIKILKEIKPDVDSHKIYNIFRTNIFFILREKYPSQLFINHNL